MRIMETKPIPECTHMTVEKQASVLAALANRPTSYEVILTDGRITYWLPTFSQRHTRAALYDIAYSYWDRVVAVTDETSFAWDSKTKSYRGLGTGWTIRYGRTKREVVQENSIFPTLPQLAS